MLTTAEEYYSLVLFLLYCILVQKLQNCKVFKPSVPKRSLRLQATLQTHTTYTVYIKNIIWLTPVY